MHAETFTPLHAAMHADLVALYPLPYALRILPDTAISAGMHATCTPECMPARQNLHTHLRASYILLIYMLELIRHAYTWFNTRGTDVC